MPNTIKYSTTGDTLSLKKGNFFIGVGDVGKGPSTSTGHYQGISPPPSGYTIYVNTSGSQTSIFCANNDAELVRFTNGFSSNQTNYISNGGNFANGTLSPFNSNYSDSGGVGQVVSITNDLPYVGSQSSNAMYLNYNGGRVMSTVGLLTTGVTYTFSFWAKIISGSSFSVSWNNQNGLGDTNAWTSSANLTTSWQRYTQTFTLNASKNNFYFYSRSADTTRAAIFTEFQVTTGSTYGGPGLQNATECLRWYAVIPNNMICVNEDYEPIITDGLLVNVDAGFTPSYPKTGTTLYGISINGNNGTLTNGPTYTSQNGGGFVMDGVDDTYSITGVSMGTSALTLDCWFKFQTNSIYLPTVCGAGDLWSGDGQTGWGFGSQSNTYQFKMLKTGSSQNVSISTPVNTMIYNFVGTRTISGTQQILKGYVNGKYINQSVGNSIFDLSTSLYPGSYDPTTLKPKVYSYSSPPPATIYSIKVYNRDLSATEVLQNYQATLPRMLTQNIITNGLVYYVDAGYAGSYVSGTTWFDVSGNGNDSTLTNGPTFNSDNGGSIVFDGVDDNVQRNALNVGNNFTVGVWARPNSATRKTLVANSYNYNGTPSTTEGFLFNIGNSGTDIFLSLGRDLQYRISQTGLVNANTWFYGCATYDGTTIKLYFNGVETSYSGGGGSPFSITYNTKPLYLGYWVNGNTPYSSDIYAGRIGLTQIYNRALSASEILQNYNAQKSRFGL